MKEAILQYKIMTTQIQVLMAMEKVLWANGHTMKDIPKLTGWSPVYWKDVLNGTVTLSLKDMAEFGAEFNCGLLIDVIGANKTEEK